MQLQHERAGVSTQQQRGPARRRSPAKRASGEGSLGRQLGRVVSRAWRASARAALLLFLGCGGAQTTTRASAPADPSLHHGPLTDFVPAAGLRWMVVARPRELLRDASIRSGVEKLFPNERLDVFATQSGIDLRRLETGCIAGFDIGTLYLAQTHDSVETVEKAFLARLASEPVIKHPGSGVVHVTGLIGLTPESFVGVSKTLVGVSVKDPTLTKIVGAYALGKLKKSPSALSGAALRNLPSSLSMAPLQFYAPGPFAGDWAKGAYGLLGSSVAVGIAARVDTPGALDVLVLLTGDYGADTAITIERARVSFEDLSQSNIGRLLSLQHESLAPEIQATPTEVTLRLRLPITPLLEGLYAAVAANVWEMLNYQPR